MNEKPLAGRTIAVPETREIELFAGLLERRGANVLRVPLIAIRDAPDPAPVLAFARAIAQNACDDLILTTGEGLVRLLGCIERHEPTLRDHFVSALARVRKIVRGPKPARALRELALSPDLTADPPTTEGLIDRLKAEKLRGRRVGLQLYGNEPYRPLQEFLERAGATSQTVAPYVYADASDDAAVRELLVRLNAQEVDAIAFTNSTQVERLFAVATPQLVCVALAHTVVAAIGPVVASALERHGVKTRLMPRESFFLKPLTTALEEALSPRS
jgi:uroporphyrinogen-III synthase